MTHTRQHGSRDRLRFVVLAAATSFLALLAAVSPAFAEKVTINVGDNYASVDTATGWIEVCDMDEDGNGVFGYFGYPGGELYVHDGNGSKGGCGNDYLPALPAIEFSLCEDGIWPTCNVVHIAD